MSNEKRIQKALNVRPGEWKLLIVFLLLIMLNTITLESAGVVATSSFLAELGTNYIPLLWIVDMSAILLSSICYTLIADRFPRRYLLQGLMIVFSMSLLILRWLLDYIVPDVIYTILYIVIDQQMVFFPLAFWAFANDKYTIAASKRLFPIIAAGGLIGNALGNWLAGRSAKLFTQLGLANDDLLFLCSLTFISAWGIVFFTFRKDAEPALSRFTKIANTTPDLRATWNTGKDFIKNIPLFRYLILALFFSEIVMTFVEYHFLAQTTIQFTDVVGFQIFYGSYRALLTLLSLPLQLFIASRILEKVGLKNVFFIFPSILFTGSLLAAIFPGFTSTIGMSASSNITLNALEKPARKSVQGLIPDAKRGRVGTFLDNYVYTIGTIIGCLLLEFFIILSQKNVINATTMIILYESLGASFSLITLFFIFRLRKTYDESLWNPNLARRKRRSIASDLLGDL